VTSVVIDAAAVLAFLSAAAPELLEVFTAGALVTDVSLTTLESTLVRSGVKRHLVHSDLALLGLDLVLLSERRLEPMNAVPKAVPGVDFKPACAVKLAIGRHFTIVTGNAELIARRIKNLEIQGVATAYQQSVVAVLLSPAIAAQNPSPSAEGAS